MPIYARLRMRSIYIRSKPAETPPYQLHIILQHIETYFIT